MAGRNAGDIVRGVSNDFSADPKGVSGILWHD